MLEQKKIPKSGEDWWTSGGEVCHIHSIETVNAGWCVCFTQEGHLDYQDLKDFLRDHTYFEPKCLTIFERLLLEDA